MHFHCNTQFINVHVLLACQKHHFVFLISELDRNIYLTFSNIYQNLSELQRKLAVIVFIGLSKKRAKFFFYFYICMFFFGFFFLLISVIFLVLCDPVSECQ